MKRPLVFFLFGFIGFALMSFFAENASASLGLMIFLLAVIFYFIPTIISSERNRALQHDPVYQSCLWLDGARLDRRADLDDRGTAGEADRRAAMGRGNGSDALRTPGLR